MAESSSPADEVAARPSSAGASPDAAAKRAFAEGHYEEAARLYSSLLERKSAVDQRHLLLCNRSAALMKLGRYEDAASDARTAIQAAPEGFVKAHYRLACALRGAGDYAGAISECDRALLIRPGNEQLKGLRETCLSDMTAVASISGAPAAAPGMLERARKAQPAGGQAAAGPVTPGVAAPSEPGGERYLHGAAPARAGMLDRARAARKSVEVGSAAGQQAATAGAATPPTRLSGAEAEDATPVAAVNGGMLARARAAKGADPAAGGADKQKL